MLNLAALVAVAALAAPAKTVTIADSGSTVSVAAGQQLNVKLVSCGSCGYHWATKTAPSAKVLTRLGVTSVPGCAAPCAGGNETVRFRYRGRAAGTTSLELVYLPPGTGRKAAKHFKLRVRVR